LQTFGKTTQKRRMHEPSELTAPASLGVVRLRGADAVKFLQGQLSNDVARLTVAASVLAGYHNPQGRTIALLRLVLWDADDILAIVPRELASVVLTRLSKFILRAKVKITDESSDWQVSGLAGVPERALPGSVGAQARVGDAVFVRVPGEPSRWLAVSPGNAPPVPNCSTGTQDAWQRLDIAAGLPQVLAATSEEFVAQMLNLDVLDAIAFDKGCYTGQEVIARAHYRGRVKRRMQRFISREPVRLKPGDSGQLADGRSFKVVLAAPTVAVSAASAAATQAPLPTAASTQAAAPAAVATSNTSGAPAGPLAADQVPLPYALPE
jgi:tRNA-modifying protein YgfZ